MTETRLVKEAQGLVNTYEGMEYFKQPVIVEFFDANVGARFEPGPEKQRVNGLADNVEEVTIAVSTFVVLVEKLLGVKIG